jgi:adenylate cyclase
MQWLPGALLAALLCLHAAQLVSWTPVRQLDAWVHDLRLWAFARDRPDARVAVVDIDERSLAVLGRWPWSRARLAELLQRLFVEQKAALVGLDLILAEPDTSTGLAVLDAWAAGALRDDARFQAEWSARRAALDADGQLAAVLASHPVVLGFHVSRGAHAVRTGSLPPALMPATSIGALPRFDGFGGNLERLTRAARGAGFLESWVDPDGVRRQAPLLVEVDGQVHASLALALVRARLGQPEVALVQARSGLRALELSDGMAALRVPMGEDASVVLPYARPSGDAPSFSAIDVLQGRVAPASLRGRVVLVGTTVPGLGDRHATPVSEHLPGVQAHAALLSALLDARVPHVPQWARLADFGLLVGLALLVVPLARLSLAAASALSAGVVALLVGTNFALWAQFDLALPLAAALLLSLGLLAWRMVYGQVWERRERRRLEALFGRYVPPELVERMSRDPQHYDMQGRNAELTVLFADLRGFTRLSEALPAAELARMMNDFFSEMTDIVRHHGGTLDKYIGDSVMAFWGAPVASPAHARQAVTAAQEMLERLPALNARFAQQGWPAVSLGIGINSGIMVVGDLGSRHRRAYTVLGDAVNVASRLQELTQTFGTDILLGEATQARLAPHSCRLVGTASLRGRLAPVTVYAPQTR